MPTPEDLAQRAAAAAPRLTEAQRALIREALGPGAETAARRHRLGEVKRRRRWSGALDDLCGFQRPERDPNVDHYVDGALGVDDREGVARRLAS